VEIVKYVFRLYFGLFTGRNYSAAAVHSSAQPYCTAPTVFASVLQRWKLISYAIIHLLDIPLFYNVWGLSGNIVILQ
jgi:hypothetical protein